VLAAALGACGGPSADDGPAAPDPTTPPLAAAPDLSDVRAYRATRRYDAVAAPTTLRIPAIGVRSDLQRLALDATGAIEVPVFERAGWWADGPRPGQAGPAAILGHVDSRTGPAVFARLGELVPGDEALVDREDGTTARFVVSAVERHPKDAFPTAAVYGPTLEPGLRLVTCGGSFDRATGHYRDNVIVFAALAG
jgi:sortase (surface protein transpeptidase)